MKSIVVKNQIRLGLGRSLRLSISGMYYRITRSAITVLILSLAVAFLSYILFFGVIGQDTKYNSFLELRKSHSLGEWITRLSKPDPLETIYRNVLADDFHVKEYKVFGRLTDEEINQLKYVCNRLLEFNKYFENMPLSYRAILISDSSPQDVVKQLSDIERRKLFLKMILDLKLAVPMGSKDELTKLVTVDIAKFYDLANKIQTGQNLALHRIHTVLNNQTVTEAVAKKNKDFITRVRNEGFVLPDSVINLISKQARIDLNIKYLGTLLDVGNIKIAVSRKLGIAQSEVNTIRLLMWVSSKSKASWLVNTLSNLTNKKNYLSVNDILTMSESYRRNALLQNAVGDEIPSNRDGVFSLPTRTMWLILVSFIVCVIGISNTMLMSVTDRFAEIATMKCLGAMDTFIMTLYVFEAMFQGIAGSFLGVILGLLLALFRGVAEFGGLVFEWLPIADILIIAFLSFITGIIIAAFAAMWPSWSAARLAPMEAMRVE